MLVDRWLHEQGYRYAGASAMWDLSMLHVDWLAASEDLRKLNRSGLSPSSARKAMEADGPSEADVRAFMRG